MTSACGNLRQPITLRQTDSRLALLSPRYKLSKFDASITSGRTGIECALWLDSMLDSRSEHSRDRQLEERVLSETQL